MKTKLTEMFGIEYPIVQSGMQWLAVPQHACRWDCPKRAA